MSDFLNDYIKFVDYTTSEPSRDLDTFMDMQHILEENGWPAQRLITAAMGLSAESGEFTEIVKKIMFQGKPMDDDTRNHMIREMGDVVWYLAQACIALNVSLKEVIDTNIVKLEARYPNGFSAFDSENRKEGDL